MDSRNIFPSAGFDTSLSWLKSDDSPLYNEILLSVNINIDPQFLDFAGWVDDK